METKPTIPNAPVETSTHEVEVSDVKRQDFASENLLGAVVVGGRYGADCFIPDHYVRDTDGDGA